MFRTITITINKNEIGNQISDRQICALLREVGMLANDIQGWSERLQSVSAIVQQGCRSNGIPDAGTLLLDMISELLQDILRNHDPTPAAAATD